MKNVTHKLWPVSYINDSGNQVDSLYTFDPSRVDETYWVGEPILLAASHADGMEETAKADKIAELKAKIANLESEDDAA